MKYKTGNTIIIEMRDLDHGTALVAFLERALKQGNAGGDLCLGSVSDTGRVGWSMGIGHDVRYVSVRHLVGMDDVRENSRVQKDRLVEKVTKGVRTVLGLEESDA